MIMRFFAVLVATTMFVPALSLEAETTPLPVAVPPTDSHLRYVGRFDTHEAAGPRCSWSASTVMIKFQGTALNAKIVELGQNYWQVVIDGEPGAVLELMKGEHLYSVAAGLKDGEHTVELVKATEGFVGVTQFTGFQLNEGAALLAVPAKKRRIEVIGDSISCGYGNMAAAKEEHFSPKTENAYYTYGAIAARQVEADYSCVAFSGRKMWPDNTTPELYDRTLTFDPTNPWDFSKNTPDAIVVNLATNDFGRGIPDEAGWTAAYVGFIHRLREHAPKARIYCAIGTMMSDFPPNKPLTALRRYLDKIVADCGAAGDANVSILDFGTQAPVNGIGADWHPSKKTQELMGAQLAGALKRDLGW